MAIKSLLPSAVTSLAIVAAAAGVSLVLYSWNLPPFHGSMETTNDAYIQGKVTAIAPQLAGYVVDVPVQDFQHVKKGDLLVKIDDRIYAQKLAQAKATLQSKVAALTKLARQRASARATVESRQAALESAEAALKQAKADWKRKRALQQKGFSANSAADESQASYDQAQASVRQARAALVVAQQDLEATIADRQQAEADLEGAGAAVRLAEIDLQNTRITAPADGTLGQIGARVGQYVSAGSSLTSLVTDTIWMVANFKETQLPGMKTGQKVSFSVDALGGLVFHGRIERFSPATGSEFSVIKSDNATGNFTKIAKRLPVRIAIDAGQPDTGRLVPGLSVVASVDVASAPLPPTSALAEAEPQKSRVALP
ncbi:multidrug resistance efflux pump [Breoghania corrubedonensis]|uniref:Multidrug resistance efflux pump n=1 Tax=Breoghania corrubedonensis TaxID=665038 RepID=A0A2T5V6L3_9HYPH|nr:HlyD family secretion protein [Breoghania corrubedonensis]PTW59391.1 multidrug resistance efflux pump [Breoghania corrubedonensis]